jgi:hypothetical protein
MDDIRMIPPLESDRELGDLLALANKLAAEMAASLVLPSRLLETNGSPSYAAAMVHQEMWWRIFGPIVPGKG